MTQYRTDAAWAITVLKLYRDTQNKGPHTIYNLILDLQIPDSQIDTVENICYQNIENYRS